MGNEFNACPFCGCEDIFGGAFSFSADCHAICQNPECGATIETEVPWNGMSEEEHDKECFKKLLPMWNRRA